MTANTVGLFLIFLVCGGAIFAILRNGGPKDGGDTLFLVLSILMLISASVGVYRYGLAGNTSSGSDYESEQDYRGSSRRR